MGKNRRKDDTRIIFFPCSCRVGVRVGTTVICPQYVVFLLYLVHKYHGIQVLRSFMYTRMNSEKYPKKTTTTLTIAEVSKVIKMVCA